MERKIGVNKTQNFLFFKKLKHSYKKLKKAVKKPLIYYKLLFIPIEYRGAKSAQIYNLLQLRTNVVKIYYQKNHMSIQLLF